MKVSSRNINTWVRMLNENRYVPQNAEDCQYDTSEANGSARNEYEEQVTEERKADNDMGKVSRRLEDVLLASAFHGGASAKEVSNEAMSPDEIINGFKNRTSTAKGGVVQDANGVSVNIDDIEDVSIKNVSGDSLGFVKPTVTVTVKLKNGSKPVEQTFTFPLSKVKQVVGRTIKVGGKTITLDFRNAVSSLARAKYGRDNLEDFLAKGNMDSTDDDHNGNSNNNGQPDDYGDNSDDEDISDVNNIDVGVHEVDADEMNNIDDDN